MTVERECVICKGEANRECGFLRSGKRLCAECVEERLKTFGDLLGPRPYRNSRGGYELTLDDVVVIITKLEAKHETEDAVSKEAATTG